VTRLVDMFLRGVVDRVTDSSKFQGVVAKLRAYDDLEDGPDGSGVEHWLPYGFTAVAKAGAEALVGYLGGDSDKAVVISVGDRRYRLTGLAEGEVALYDDQGAKVHLTRSGIVLEPASGQTVELGGTGGAQVARNGDGTIVDGTTDSALFVFLGQVQSGIVAAGGTCPPPPTTITGKVSAGSTTVKAVA